MKSFLMGLLVIATIMNSACGNNGRSGGGGTGVPGLDNIGKSEGGVGVGNLSSTFVPGTQASMSYSNPWKTSEKDTAVLFDNGAGSKIKAERTTVEGLTEPNSEELVAFLQKKYPERQYKAYAINGFNGARALAEKAAALRSDAYLISPTKEIIRIQADLLSQADGLVSGKKIMESVRIEYRGVPMIGEVDHTIELPFPKEFGDRNSLYLFLNHQTSKEFTDSPNGTRAGVLVGYSYNRRVDDFTIGLAGSASGRIVELGSEKESPYEAVKVDGKYIVSKAARYPLEDIYSEFSPKKAIQGKETVILKEGTVYLIRTIDWAGGEDMVLKMRVDRLVSKKSVRLTYQNLVRVPEEEIKATIEKMNEYTLANEATKDSGEVTLYSRNNWGDYQSASFSFRYGTRDNFFITQNGSDLFYEGREGDLNYFTNTGPVSNRGTVIDVGEKKSLDKITLADFPELNQVIRSPELEAVVGHTYLIVSMKNDYILWGAFKVLEVDPKHRWTKIQWRRLKTEKPYRFQKWTQLPVDSSKVGEMELDLTDLTRKSYFDGPAVKRADNTEISKHMGPMYSNLEFSAQGSNPGKGIFYFYGRGVKENTGFIKLSNLKKVEEVTSSSEMVSFKEQVDIESGGVYLVSIEDYWHKSVIAMEVIDFKPQQSVKIRYRVLSQSRAVGIEKWLKGE